MNQQKPSTRAFIIIVTGVVSAVLYNICNTAFLRSSGMQSQQTVDNSNPIQFAIKTTALQIAPLYMNYKFYVCETLSYLNENVYGQMADKTAVFQEAVLINDDIYYQNRSCDYCIFKRFDTSSDNKCQVLNKKYINQGSVFIIGINENTQQKLLPLQFGITQFQNTKEETGFLIIFIILVASFMFQQMERKRRSRKYMKAFNHKFDQRVEKEATVKDNQFQMDLV
ncbi:Hypothetical_protein [Hexamita inflata]|uniref:Hypothetical_protein n=1 Tax=Hexamita inflata TaxID=28002 RepID=A0AA86P973_9EUKA|nr:Hypothetical protein HINF_LOCUS20170 [Hexamita inflata]